MHNDAVVVGYSATFPQAARSKDIWKVLTLGLSAITDLPEDRWGSNRFLGGIESVSGRSVSRRAGGLDDIWSFDASRFGISPREAKQMDPQQRILLEVVNDAFDHAGVNPASLDGKRTGVFVGASSADHSAVAFQDPSEVESHFMLGNTLSILANRISFVWNFQGPSITIDTACSSSLVALDLARADIASGRIDTAVVAGVNILLSPIPFIGFSQAGMLSPSGLCRPFAEGADGYVRSDGAVVFILQRASVARELGLRIRSELAGTGVNTAGRGGGITVPSMERQASLISDVLARSGAVADDIVYLEAHGTGTAVGDPTEARAIGAAIGQYRSLPLPIGSLKSNFGHLEPASGLAGLLKAQLILENGIIPPTIHAESLNSAIDFEGLGLDVVRTERELPQSSRARVVGVNSFGFGGVNAHALLRESRIVSSCEPGLMPRSLFISAPSQQGLRPLIEEWKTLAASDEMAAELGDLVANANWNRARYRHRLCFAAGSQNALERQLDLWLSGGHIDGKGIEAIGENLPVVFLFSGNGAVWEGMARQNYLNDASFRSAFGSLAELSSECDGPDLVELLFSPNLGELLSDAPVAQPLHFAIQVALCQSLAAQGLVPAACLGHSLGEVGAAVVSGVISAEAGMHIVVSRANAFSVLRGTGTMAAFSAGKDEIQAVISGAGLEIDIAAENAVGQVTVSGSERQIDVLIKVARRKRIAGKRLDVPYPYHGRAVRKIEDKLRVDLEVIDFATGNTTATFYSGCRGNRYPSQELDADYWLQNAIQPVEFRAASDALCKDGFKLFLEISPQAAISPYMRSTLEHLGIAGLVLESLEKRKPEQRDAAGIARRVLAAGGAVKQSTVLGSRRAYRTDPPSAAFERKVYHLAPKNGFDIFARAPSHPLLGGRSEAGAPRWRSSLSLNLQPWLIDHSVSGRPVLPATAIVEIFLAAARDTQGHEGATELRDVELLSLVEVTKGTIVELLTEFEPTSRRLTLSRRVLDSWQPVALARAFSAAEWEPPTIPEPKDAVSCKELYDRLWNSGLEYGSGFALVDRVALRDDLAIVELREVPSLPGCALDPATADAGFHALALLIADSGNAVKVPLVPSRIGRVRLCGSGPIRRASLRLGSVEADGIRAEIDLSDHAGHLVARFEELRLRPLLVPATTANDLWIERSLPLPGRTEVDLEAFCGAVKRPSNLPPSNTDILRAAVAARLAWDIVVRGVSTTEPEEDVEFKICTDWLAEQGLLTHGKEGLELTETCPWPALDVLVPALAETGDACQGDLESVLQRLVSQGTDIRRIEPLQRLIQGLEELIVTAPLGGRIALVGAAPRAVIEHILARGLTVTLVVPEANRCVGVDMVPGLRTAALDDITLSGGFDVVLGMALSQCVETFAFGSIARLLAPGAVFVSLEESADLFALLMGRHRTVTAINQMRTALEREGLATSVDETCFSESILLVSGRRDVRIGELAVHVDVRGEGPWAEALRANSAVGAEVRIVVVLLDPSAESVATEIRSVLRSLPHGTAVWLMDIGLSRFEMLSGWRRVLVNETGHDLRLCAVSADAEPARVVQLLSCTVLREIRIDSDTATSPYLLPLDLPARLVIGEPALKLEIDRRNLGLKGLQWMPVARRNPGPGEVEIAVAATGLNFRDVMWGQGLIPPEGLEGGFAGPGFGMECTGRVVGAGPESGFVVGQEVAAFSPDAFASHVTVPASAVFTIPEGLSLIEGAAIPVAFLTADYALVELARLSPKETVLIHGGAGGVGLAAIQIAQSTGARVFATAGSPAKRRYLEMLGVDDVFDSRSLAFSDSIMLKTEGRGVDVVLNSLAGEALERGVSCLAPFGRFIELGKRDIFANNAIALRALKNNISFMAVDVDQLLCHRPEIARRVMGRVADGFECGRLRPLPISTMSAPDVGEAFHLMKRSGHIGKIVVKAPVLPVSGLTSVSDFSGTWLVTGGTGGFGLATAEWLVKQGARDLWLISRSGELTDEALDRLLPAHVHLRSVDASNASDMDQLADEISAAGSGLDGIVHSAGVIRDGLFANLAEADITAVLAPKVLGAANVDRIARSFAPRHVWFYSSVSARFGNPGQSAYVAANRALEGLAEGRSAEGLPALAVAWGPIEDGGMLSRDPSLREATTRQLGGSLTAANALDRLKTLLEGGFDQPTVTIAPIEWGRLQKDIAVLAEPLFDFIERKAVLPGASKSLIDLVAELGEARARKEATTIMFAEMANILRCEPSDIDASRPISGAGFDSLMAMNLRMALEERLGVDLPLQALGADLTPSELVGKIFQSLETSGKDDIVDFMLAAHVTDTTLDAVLREEIKNHASSRTT